MLKQEDKEWRHKWEKVPSKNRRSLSFDSFKNKSRSQKSSGSQSPRSPGSKSQKSPRGQSQKSPRSSGSKSPRSARGHSSKSQSQKSPRSSGSQSPRGRSQSESRPYVNIATGPNPDGTKGFEFKRSAQNNL